MKPTKEGLALAAKLEAAGANFSDDVWDAIYEGRTYDFLNHPDYLAFSRSAIGSRAPKEVDFDRLRALGIGAPSPEFTDTRTKPRWYWAILSALVKAARWVLRRGKQPKLTSGQQRQLDAGRRLPMPPYGQYEELLKRQAKAANKMAEGLLVDDQAIVKIIKETEE